MKKAKNPYGKIQGTGISREKYITWNTDHGTWRVELYDGAENKYYIGAYKTKAHARIARNAALEMFNLLQVEHA